VEPRGSAFGRAGVEVVVLEAVYTHTRAIFPETWFPRWVRRGNVVCIRLHEFRDAVLIFGRVGKKREKGGTNMKHLESLTIHRFRGMEEMSFEGLGDVNVFVGKNNSGKTSALEAIQLFCNPLDIPNWRSVTNNHSMPRGRFWFGSVAQEIVTLFPHSFNLDKTTPFEIPIQIEGEISPNKIWFSVDYEEVVEENKPDFDRMLDEEASNYYENNPYKRGIRLNFDLVFNDNRSKHSIKTWYEIISSSEDARGLPYLKFSIISPSELTTINYLQDYTQAVINNNKPEILSLLRKFDSNIEDLEILFPGNQLRGQGVLTIHHKKLHFPPLSIFGDGLKKVFGIIVRLAATQGGALGIDEIESSLHSEALQETFVWLINACQEMNVQLFCTTHSLEALDAILSASEKIENVDFVAYHLNQQNENPEKRVIRYPGDKLDALRAEYGFDPR